ncbi:hypothetical protein Fot_57072 [Forsythia ovata]|uniref:Uncharacterized protein n=1 Tax=Forsythia ovata TaxID=205694 RepID=A0ABD1NXK8_9LAMI
MRRISLRKIKSYDQATKAQEVTAKSLEEVNEQKNELIEKVAELENDMDFLRKENFQLKEENLKLERGTEEVLKAGSFFVNYRARQELHPNVDISSIEADYPTLEDVDD